MTATNDRKQRSILQSIARRVMRERGLMPSFPPEALAELDRIQGPATQTEEATRDLRNLSWCSIDNYDSRDLDQLSVAEAMPAGAVKVLVAIADVDALVKKQSALDERAQQNTTSVYTAGEIFPMLPEKLSTDLTSLTMKQTAWLSSLKWSSPGTDRFRVPTSMARRFAIGPSWLTTALGAGWRVTGRCRRGSKRSPVWPRTSDCRTRQPKS
jgi:hypothetical protein